MGNFPGRGEVWLVEFPDDPKSRPALIVSPDVRNELANSVLAVPITTNLRPAPTHVWHCRQAKAGCCTIQWPAAKTSATCRSRVSPEARSPAPSAPHSCARLNVACSDRWALPHERPMRLEVARAIPDLFHVRSRIASYNPTPTAVARLNIAPPRLRNRHGAPHEPARTACEMPRLSFPKISTGNSFLRVFSYAGSVDPLCLAARERVEFRSTLGSCLNLRDAQQ